MKIWFSVVYFLKTTRVCEKISQKITIYAALYIILNLNHLNEFTIFFKTRDFWVLYLLPHLLNQWNIRKPWEPEPKHHHGGASNGPAASFVHPLTVESLVQPLDQTWRTLLCLFGGEASQLKSAYL